MNILQYSQKTFSPASFSPRRPRRAIVLACSLLLTGCQSEENPAEGEGGNTPHPSIKLDIPTHETFTEPNSEPTDEQPIQPKSELMQHIADLASKNVVDRDLANLAINELGSDSIIALIDALRDGDKEVRLGAAFGLLGRFDPNNAPLVEVMIEALADENEKVRHVALQGVENLEDGQLAPALPLLAAILVDENETATLRRGIARRLGQLGQEAASALPPLGEVAATATDRNLRAACLYSIYKIAPAGPTAVPYFQAVLADDNDAGLRRVAARRLGGYGEAAAPAIDTLAAALADTDEEVRRAATEALSQIGPPALPRLIDALDEEIPRVREYAVIAIGSMGQRANEALPSLLAMKEDEEASVRRAVEWAIHQISGQ